MNYPAQRSTPLPPMMTVADFLEWPGDGMGTRFELVDGVLRAMAPATDTHGTIQSNINYLIALHLRARSMPCRVVANPGVQPHVRADWNFRIPDLGVTCKPNRSGDVMVPEPILLIEVLSPGNAGDTYENVRAYATIPTVTEIVVVHSARMRVELLTRDAQGHWPLDPAMIEGKDAVLWLAAINAELPLAEIYTGTHFVATS